MKCAVFNGKCNMTIDEREISEPAADEVLIKIMACGVCGSDVHIFLEIKVQHLQFHHLYRDMNFPVWWLKSERMS